MNLQEGKGAVGYKINGSKFTLHPAHFSSSPSICMFVKSYILQVVLYSVLFITLILLTLTYRVNIYGVNVVVIKRSMLSFSRHIAFVRVLAW